MTPDPDNISPNDELREDQAQTEDSDSKMGLGIAFGLALGVVFGAAFDHIGFGIAFGVAVGPFIGLMLNRYHADS